jgi:hypothetical protein
LVEFYSSLSNSWKHAKLQNKKLAEKNLLKNFTSKMNARAILGKLIAIDPIHAKALPKEGRRP